MGRKRGAIAAAQLVGGCPGTAYLVDGPEGRGEWGASRRGVLRAKDLSTDGFSSGSSSRSSRSSSREAERQRGRMRSWRRVR